MENLYYVALSSFSENGQPVPVIISVFADNAHDARALLIKACEPYLSSNADFGEVRVAAYLKDPAGFMFLNGAQLFESKEAADADAARRT